MLWTKLTLQSGVSPIDLPIVGVSPSSNYILKSVDGLGPPDVDVSISDTLYQGGVYQGRRPQNRTIVLRVGLNPNYALGQSTSDLRTALYDLLTLSAYQDPTGLSVQVVNGTTVLMWTNGFVSKFETVPFSKDPEVQITITCTDPYFHGFNVNIPTSGLAKNSFTLTNAGSAPAGFDLGFTFTAAVTNFKLTLGSKFMNVQRSFAAGETLYFLTAPGGRQVNLIASGGLTTPLIGQMTSDSDWLMLLAGANLFSTSSQLYNFYAASYTPTYWGV